MMNRALDIRSAVFDDVAGCAAVVNGWIDKTSWMARVHTPEAIEGFIADALPAREIWVVGDPIEGYLSFNPETKQIGALYCSRTGAGLGKALMDHTKSGRDFVWLSTHEPNLKAQAFYKREGFVEVARMAPTPPELVPEIKMEWHA